ncbi:MAG: aldehyde ferredoxin oxidoreductase family protein [Fimbriimonadales bacterium]
MKGGYTGKVLCVDLTSQKVRDEGLPEEKVLKDFLGCWGVALRTLYDMTPPGVRAEDPDNPLIFWNGPLTGADVPGATNLSVATVNFNTNFTAGRSHSHGELGIKLKKAGYDALIITGRSEKPVYLQISDAGVKIQDASHLWGKDTHETEAILMGELGDSFSIGAIGPVGENLGAGGMVCAESNHSFAHSGIGSIFGSKKLKALCTQGSKAFPIAHPEKMADIRKRWVQAVMAGHRYSRSRNAMHFKNDFVHMKDHMGLVGKNFQVNQFYDFAVGLHKHKITAQPCPGCPQACPADIELVSGPHKGLVATISGGGEGPEGAGSILGIAEPEHWVYLLDLYDRMGVESSVIGCTMAMAIEAFEKGIITTKDTDGLVLKWGDAEVVEKMVRKYAYKEGFGAILALGPLGAARAIGGDAPSFAVHLKGSGINLHDWRNSWGMFLCHAISGGSGWPGTAADSIGPEADAGYPQFTAPFDYKAKALEAKKTSILKFMRDTNGTCGFMTWNVPGSTEIVREAVNAVTGWDLTTDEVVDVGERIMNLERAFNVRRGLTPEDDYNLSPRLLEAPKDGRQAGKPLAPYIRSMIDDFYNLMGWDKKTGKPWRDTLKRFGLNDVARDLWT